MLSSLRAFLSRYRGFSRNAWLYLISNTIQALSAAAVGVIYTLFLDDLGYGLTFIGMTLFTATAGGALAILPASALVRRYGWRTMLLWSNYIGGVAVFIQFIAPTRAVILLTSLGVGASLAIFLILNSPFLAANSAPEQRNAIFGLSNALGWLAAVTGALLGGLLPVWLTALEAPGSPTGPLAPLAPILEAARPLLVTNPEARVYQAAMLLVGALAIPSIIPIYMLSDTPHASAGQRQPANDGASAPVAHLQPANDGALAPVAHLRARLEAWLPQARAVARGVIGRFSLSQALVGLGAGLFFPYLNIYFVQGLRASTATYGALTSAVTASLALVSLASAPLADRFGRARLAVVAQIASLPFLLLMGAVPVLAVVAVAYIVRAALMNTGAAPLQAWLMDAVPQERHVLASNVYNASWQGAWAIGAAVGSGLITLGGYGLPFYVAAALYSLSALLMIRWLLPARDQRLTAEPSTSAESLAEATEAGQ
jgi:MFS family permease